MKSRVFFCMAMLLTACQPSDYFAPKPELAGGGTKAPVPSGAFPDGAWQDGIGGAWEVSVYGTNLVGKGASELLRGLEMHGQIAGDRMTYDIGFPGDEPLASGHARLVDETHALFETDNPDGTLNAHGLLHFNHEAQVPVSQPAELRPEAPCASSLPEGE